MTEKFLKVEGNEELIRDTSTNAIINTSKEDYIRTKRIRQEKRRDKERLDRVEETLEQILNLLKDKIS